MDEFVYSGFSLVPVSDDCRINPIELRLSTS